MGIFRKSISLLFAPLTKPYKKFKKFWKKRNKFSKFILAILISIALAIWFLLFVYSIGTVLILNLGILWVRGVWNFAMSIVNAGSSKITGRKKGKQKRSPPRKKKPRGGRKNRRKGITRG